MNGEGYTLNEAGQAVIAEMAPGATVTVKATYEVTQEDIDSNAELKNVALVEGDNGTDPDPNPEIPIPEEEKKPGLTATKAVTNTGTGENGKFKKGDTAEFDITVTNSGNTTQTNVTVTEQLAGAEIVTGEGYTINEDNQAVIAEMKPGATVVLKATYTVTQADIDSDAKLKNVALVKSDNGTEPDPQPEVEIPEEPQIPGVNIIKKVDNGGTAKGSVFRLGETIYYQIIVENTGNTTWNGLEVKDDKFGTEVNVYGDGVTYYYNENEKEIVLSGLAPKKRAVITYPYVVTVDDIERGSVENTATAGNASSKKTVDTDDRHPTLEAEKKLTNSGSGTDGQFVLGDTAKFDIIVKNTGNVKQTVTVTEGLAGAKIVQDSSYTINVAGEAVITDMAPGATVTVKAEYTITQEDIDSGNELWNHAAVRNQGNDGPDPSVEIPVEKAPAWTVDKTVESRGSNGGSFRLGEIIQYQIVVKNTGNTTLNDLSVVDEMFETAKDINVYYGKGVTYTYTRASGQVEIDGLAPDNSVVITYSHKVTEDDIKAGSVTNKVVAGDEGKEITTEVEPQRKALSAVKSLTNAGTGANGAFKAGEKATFNITVTNEGNLTQENVTVTEELASAKIVAGNGYTINAEGQAVIEKLAPGQTVVVKAEYTVTQADIDSDVELKNIALVEGDNGENPGPEPEEVIPKEEKNPGLTATKTVTNAGTGANGAFKAGEKAEFNITVTNSGNTTQTNVTVTEQLDGAEIVAGTGYTVNEAKQAVITEMAPGATVIVYAKYTVTQADIDSDVDLKNIALVKGDNGGKTDPTPEVKIPEEPKAPGLTAVKTLASLGTGANGAFKADETATFNITVTNSGNTTQTNVTVTEQLDGAKIVAGTGYTVNEAGQAVIAEMEPGATVTVKAEYTVTQADIDSDAELKNIALVEGDNGQGPDPKPEVEIPKEEKNPGLTATKSVTNAPEGGFAAGQTAEFDITVTNSGNTTQTDVIVTELLVGAVIVAGDGYTINEDGQAVIAEMAPGAEVVVKATYTVTQADIADGQTLTNTARVDGDTGNAPDPVPGVVIPENIPIPAPGPGPDPTTPDPGTPDPGTPAPEGTPVPIVPVAAMPDAGVLGVIRLPEEEDEEGVESGVLGERRGVLGVHTGDEAPVAGMLGLMGIAALAVEELLRRRKKNAR